MSGGEALSAADSPGGAVGASGNPGSALVAERQDARSGFEGLGIIEDGHALVEAIQGGSWTGTALGVAFTGLDVASAVSDPIGTLISMGLGWALEWVRPFNELFNALAGDAAQVEANAQTWENVAMSLGAAGAQLEEDTTTCLSDMAGDGIEAIRTSADGVAEHVQAASQWAQAMADGLRMASGIVQVVHDVVRQAISDLIGTICSVAIEEACTLGLATALVVEQITTRVAALSTHVFEAIGHLKTAFSSFHGLLSELGRLWNTLTGAISSMFHRAAAAVTPHGPVAGTTAAVGIGGAPHGTHGPHASAQPAPPAPHQRPREGRAPGLPRAQAVEGHEEGESRRVPQRRQMGQEARPGPAQHAEESPCRDQAAHQRPGGGTPGPRGGSQGCDARQHKSNN